MLTKTAQYKQARLIGNLSINSVRNKFDQLKDTVMKYIHVLILTEAKLDESFLISQFLMKVFSKSYRFNRMVYTRNYFPSKILEKHSCLNYIECLFIEFHFRKCKWLFAFSMQRIIRHLKLINIILIIQIKPLTLISSTKRFCSFEISTRK